MAGAASAGVRWPIVVVVVVSLLVLLESPPSCVGAAASLEEEGVAIKQGSSCVAEVGGKLLNLEPLQRTDGRPRFVTVFNGWNFSFNPCSAFNEPENPHVGFGDGCHHVSVCKFKTEKRAYYYAIGIQSGVKIQHVFFPFQNTTHLSLIFKGIRSHRHKHTFIALLCDQSRQKPNEAEFKILNDEKRGNLYAHLKHKCSCISGCLNLDWNGKNASDILKNATVSEGGEEEEDNTQVMMMVISVNLGLFMFAMLIGGLCYKKRTSLKIYQKLPGIHSQSSTAGMPPGDRASNMKRAFRDYEPTPVSPSKRKVLTVLDNCVIPATDIQTGHRLGGGIFADTYVGQWKEVKVAVKYLTLNIHQNQLTAVTIEWMKNEVKYFSRLRHQNIVSVLGLCLEMKHPCVIVEYVDGISVKEYLKSNFNIITWPQRARICLQAADGMAFLHSSKPPVFHRDIRCANIFITEQDIVKIADFGVTKLLQPVREECTKDDCVCQKSFSACSSLIRWTAPEVLHNPTAQEGGQLYTLSSDVYSFGMVMWELMVNEDPFGDFVTEAEVVELVKHGGRPAFPHNIKLMPEYVELLKLCWDSNPQKRPKFKEVAVKCKEVLHHSRPFQKSIRKLLQSTEQQESAD